MATAETKTEAGGRPSLGKIRLDAACLQGGGGGCPAEKLLYVIFGIIGDNHVCNCLIFYCLCYFQEYSMQCI